MFIVIDGTDGVGKTTQAQLLADYLRNTKNLDTIVFSEPTNESAWGRKIKEAISTGKRLSPEDEAKCFIEDRRYDVVERIKPALKQGKTVVLDRYYYSTIAYQSARGLSAQQLYADHLPFIIEPDVAIILHCEIDIAMQRLQSRGTLDIMEQKEYQRKVDEIFRSFDSDNIYHLEASADIETVRAKIVEIVENFLNEKKQDAN